MKKVIFFALVLIPLIGIAQKHDNVWMFGYDSNLLIPGVEGTLADFGENQINFTYIPTQTNIFSTNATISDSEGNLLFYTNGCHIADATHNIMENGEGLNPGEVYNSKCGSGSSIPHYTAGTQSCLILPRPGSVTQYFLFHKLLTYVYEPAFDGISTLLYSVVDVALNDNKGAVVEKNIPVIEDSLTYGQLSAVKHGNGEDWWVLTGGDNNNKYFTLLITEVGINNLFEQQIGDSTSHSGSRGGDAIFSPGGTKYVRYSAQDGVFLFDFDREEGVLSNFRHLPVPEIESVISGGVAISPNSRYLYVSHTVELYQYDLQAEDIEASKILIDTFDGFQSPFGTLFYTMQLAPDCRIYMTSQNSVNVLHVINNPDEEGGNCNFDQHSVELPYNHGLSIPTFPNYRLGPLVEGVDPDPPCELVVGVEEPDQTVPHQNEKVYVFPNPATDYFKVVFEEELTTPAQVVLYDGLGRKVFGEKLEFGFREFRLSLDGLRSGLFFYEVKRGGKVMKSGKLVVMK